jgi:hypothetical protein
MTYTITATEEQLIALQECIEYLRASEANHFDECEANDQDTSQHIYAKVLTASEALWVSESEV